MITLFHLAILFSHKKAKSEFEGVVMLRLSPDNRDTFSYVRVKKNANLKTGFRLPKLLP
jgi:hypothetical protein